MRFKLLKGNHNEGRKTYKEGETVVSDNDLHRMFPGKFEVASDEPILVTSPVKTKAAKAPVAEAPPEGDFDSDEEGGDDDHTGDETKDIAKTKKSGVEKHTLPKRTAAHTPTRPIRR